MCKISEMNLETAKYYGYEAQSNQLVYVALLMVTGTPEIQMIYPLP